jgi:hypothetical protein
LVTIGGTVSGASVTGLKLYGLHLTTAFAKSGSTNATISPFVIGNSHTLDTAGEIYYGLYSNQTVNATTVTTAWLANFAGSLTNSASAPPTIGLMNIGGTLTDNNAGNNTVVRPYLYNPQININNVTSAAPHINYSISPTITVATGSFDCTNTILNLTPSN